MDHLNRLLDRSLAFAPEYAEGLSSHLPMALHALAALGADAPRLEAFFAHYARRFDGQPSPRVAAPHADWRSARGDFAQYAALRAAFAAALHRDGRDAVLREALPALWPGVAAAAFHGAIRTAHAVEAGHAGELAAALAYWAARWQPMPAAAATQALAFDAWADAVEQAAHGWRGRAPLISGRMRAVAHSDAYRRLAQGPRRDPQAFDQLWRWAAALYADTGNFTVLHLVTGVRAIGVLAPWAADADALAGAVWPAVTAAALASGIGVRGTGPRAASGWPDVVARAIASDDDHVIKLVHAGVQGAARWGDEPFLRASARAVG